jgi:hypothetical protein
VVVVLAGRGTPKFTYVNLFVGSRMALVCHRRRGPFNSTSGDSLVPFLFAYRYFTSQVFLILNLNGSFSSPPTNQRRIFIELYSGETTITVTSAPLNLVRHCLLFWREEVEVNLLIPYAFLQQHRYPRFLV